MPEPDEDWKTEQIRLRAHALWEAAGKPEGKQDEHWEKARQAVEQWVASPLSSHAMKPRQGILPAADETNATDKCGTTIQSGGGNRHRL